VGDRTPARVLPLALLAALAVVAVVAVAAASQPKRYPVDWRRRYHLEHAHVQRLLRQLEHVRHVQAFASRRSLTPPAGGGWRARQIAAAETIGREAAADPWPNCPDPIWNGAPSWDVTVQCENSGNWLDSPGYYRCGLQFDPMWEIRFGRLCP
jgi:hypothetical protein